MGWSPELSTYQRVGHGSLTTPTQVLPFLRCSLKLPVAYYWSPMTL